MSTAAMDAATVSVVHEPQPIAIYGSVSTADIAESVKAQLAETEDGARVVIGADDIKIIRNEGEEDADSDRLKTLGDHQIEIQIKGGGAVMRTVSIQAQER
jgi:ribosomal protein L9